MMPKHLFFTIYLITSLFCNSCLTEFINENHIPEFEFLDATIDPCENFYEFTCGNFEKLHPRPSTLNVLDHFTILEDELVQIGQKILSEPLYINEPIAVRKAKTAYSSCVNKKLLNSISTPELRTVEEVGGMPLLSTSDDSITFSWNEIGDLVGKFGVPLVFAYTVAQRSQNENVIVVSADPLSNPTLFRPRLQKSYDEVLEESFQETAKTRVTRSSTPAPFDVFLLTLAKNLIKNANITKTDKELVSEINDMATFMRRLYAGGIIDKEVSSLPTQVTLAQLQQWTDEQFDGAADINWVEYLSKIFQMSGVKITEETQFYQQGIQRIYGVLNLVKQTDPKIVKNFALLRIFLFQAPDSDYPTRTAFEDYYNAKGYQLYPRAEYCARKILDVVDTASLSYAVTHAYQRHYYNINKIEQAAEMVQNVRNSFHEILSNVDWMDNESREAALQKSENMLVLLGYPDFVENGTELDRFYENFRICGWDNYGNARNIRAFKQAYQFSQLGKPDRFFWGKSTFDPNAYYNRPNNKIVIPISMLNPVFFYGDNPVLDYSRLGSIIGHEITHGFDLNGKNYNQDGLLESWWSNNTLKSFNEKTTCFEEQYSRYYVPEIDAYVNGSYCINENLADNGGVRESYNAFKKIVQEKGLESNGTYSLDQLFFIGYGTMWCSEESDYALRVYVSSVNGYPPKRFRVIGSLSNMKEFSEAFNCPAGSNMNPENKCLLW